jgi:ParB/RepB/Spo0J family partition protein
MPRASRKTPGRAGKVAAPPAAASDLSAAQLLRLDLLDDHPDNPPGRSEPDEDLVASIRSVGLLQPLLVVPGDGGRYTIVAGHRRRASAVQAGLTEVWCQVRTDLTGPDVDVAMLVENGRRRGLAALEEAAVYARLRDRDKLSQRAIAERVGVNQSQVSRLLSLLKLPDQARAAVALEQVAVADAAQLAQYAPHPAAFDAGWQVLLRGYGNPAGAAQARLERDTRAEELRAQGVRVLDEQPGYSDKTIRPLYEVNVSEAKHAKLPCHAVCVHDNGRVTGYCTDPKRHPKARGSSTDTSAKEHEDKRERTKAMKARAEAARVVVRYGCALALAGDELRARDTWQRWDRRVALYLHRLATRGRYVPNEWERRRLREHVGILDVEAFLAVEDPTAHLPAQPALHDALDTGPTGDYDDDVVDLDAFEGRPVEPVGAVL